MKHSENGRDVDTPVSIYGRAKRSTEQAARICIEGPDQHRASTHGLRQVVTLPVLRSSSQWVVAFMSCPLDVR